ncbi:MAG TPA: sensor histidine kinase [Lacibacter sp.]|nr:sensor histidine kinase [Lacibacter sp.]
MQTETNYYYQLIIWGSAILFVISFFIITFLLVYNKKHKHFREEQIRFQQTLLQSQLEIQEQTLKNISQEIHDNVGQVLTLAKLNLTTLMMNDTHVPDQVKASQQLIAKAINDLRSLSHSLNTEYVQNMGLVRSVEYELEMLQKTGSIKTSFHLEGTIHRMDAQKELIIFRIIQEAIHNIIKHAEASSIHVTVSFTATEMQVSVADNGKGFDLSPLNDNKNHQFGLGLRNMHNRATLIGAKFNLTSELHKGTILHLRLPYNTTNHE